MHRLFLFFSLSVLWVNTFAQDTHKNKLSASLKLFLSEGSKDERYIIDENGKKIVPVFIELAANGSIPALIKKGVAIRTVAKNIATANILLSQIETIAALPDIKRIELPLLFQKTDSLMKKYITADRVLRGENPLDSAYTGKSTLIGIIDDGIDITHPEFLDSSGKTRLKALWNMDYQNVPPAGFSYGHEWVPDSIDAYSVRFKNREFQRFQMERMFGYSYHGTSVAGLAAGKNGVAPGADIVSVALTAFGDTILRSDRIIDGIAYIYSKAHAAGKKCIVNLSLGLMDGAPHDGKSMVERAIDNFCEERPDLLVCVSAGNNGNTWKHWGGFPVNPDSSFCFFRIGGKASLYFAIPKQHSHTLSISITDSRLGNINAPNISRDSIIYQTPYWRISDLIQQPAPVVMKSYFPGGLPSATIIFTASDYNDDYDELIVTVEEHSSTNTNLFQHLGRFIFKGAGTVHGWYPFANLHPQYVFDQNPYPNDPTYHISDNNYTTIIPSHAYTVLSSGAYNARNCYVNIQNRVVNTYPSCQLTYFTSHGPTQDGRIKPDIITPGENIVAPRSRFQDYLEHENILDTSHVAFGGTSAASPITAGIAALIWERFSMFPRDSIIKRIKSTAYTDSYTNNFGPVPNNITGWGKADAFKALTGISSDLQAVCSQSWVCKSNVVIIDPPPPPAGNGLFRVFPNPANGFLIIRYSSGVPLQLTMYNSIGQLIATDNLIAGNSLTRPMNLQNRAAGIYYLKVKSENGSFTKKIILVH